MVIKSRIYFVITKLTDIPGGLYMQKLRPDMDIGHNIQFLRHLAGLTQDETVAKLHLMNLNISKSTYAKLETNRMNIKVSELVALSIIFNSSFDDFFRGLRDEFSSHFD